MEMVVYTGGNQTLFDNNEQSKLSDVKARDRNEFVGLSNQGATCYLNGLLQTLFMTPEFRKAIFAWNYDPMKDGEEDMCIPLQLQRLFGRLQLSKQSAVDTVALTKSFGWENNEVFQQQDVQELTRVLFDALEETFKGTAFEKVIDELYAGELVDYIRCIDVDYQSERIDKFLDFSVAIVPFGSDKPMHSLTECIEMFLRPEILNGDNKYYAEQFDQRVDAIKGLKFGKLPHIMSVQLKRFVYDFSTENIVQKKLNDMVKFPMILDMNKYVSSKKSSSQQSSVVDNNSGTTNNVSSNEFETFLQEQLELLNSQNGSNNGNNTNGNSNNTNAHHQYFETDPDIPPLVDYTGNQHPDQPFYDKHRVIYNSMSNEDIHELLQTRGEWIYELYAVLIHSGVIGAGHYYAYIKDLVSKTWWNFNDSHVSKIDEKTVQEAWGGSGNYYSNNNSYNNSSGYSHNNGNFGHFNNNNYSLNNIYGPSSYGTATSSSNYMSSANAYMLMYRKVSLTNTPVPYPTNDMIPVYIQDMVRKQEEERARKAKEEEDKRNRCSLRVMWKGEEYAIKLSKINTIVDLLNLLWYKFNLKQSIADETEYQRQQKLAEEQKLLSTGEDKAKDTVSNSNSPTETITTVSDLNTPSYSSSNTTTVTAAEEEVCDTANTIKEIEKIVGISANEYSNSANNSNNNSPTKPIVVDTTLTTKPSSNTSNNKKVVIDLTGNTTDEEELAKLGVTSHETNQEIIKEMSLLTSEDDNYPRYNYFRLRYYNTHTKSLQDVYDYNSHSPTTTVGSQSMDQLYKLFYLETRTEYEQFEVYYSDGITINVHEFDAINVTFKPPRSLHLPKDTTIGDLRNIVSTWVSYDKQHIQFMKFNQLGPCDARGELLNHDYRHIKQDILYSDPIHNIYFEEYHSSNSNDTFNVNESLALETYKASKALVTIHYNKPGVIRQQDKSGAYVNEFTESVQIDLRWKVSELRRCIAKELQLHEEEIRLFRYNQSGSELRDDNLSLYLNQISSDMNIYVIKGRAPPPGFLHVHYQLYTPQHKDTRIVDLRKFMDEIEAIELVKKRNQQQQLLQDNNSSSSISNGLLQNNGEMSISNSSSNNKPYALNPFEDENSTTNQFVVVGDGTIATTDDDSESNSIGENIKQLNNRITQNDSLAEISSNNNHNDNNNNSSEVQSDIDTTFNDIITEAVPILDPYFDNLPEVSPFPAIASTTTTTASIYMEGGVTAADAEPLPTAPSMNNYANREGNHTHPINYQQQHHSSSSISDDAKIVNDFRTIPVDIDETIKNVPVIDDTIQPSDFGEKTISHHFMPTQYKHIDGLEDFYTSNYTQISDFRQQLTNRLIELNIVPPRFSPKKIRLRDRVGDYPGKLIHDGKTFLESSYFLHENKNMAVQLLDQEESFPEEMGNSLVYIQKWNRSTWTLSEKTEFLLSGNMTIKDVARGLCQFYNIPENKILTMVIPKETEFYLYELIEMKPPKNYGRGWFDPTKETKFLRYVNHDMRINDGELLLIQDTSEPLKELTVHDLKSIELVEVASKGYSSYNNNSSSSNNRSNNDTWGAACTVLDSGSSIGTSGSRSFQNNIDMMHDIPNAAVMFGPIAPSACGVTSSTSITPSGSLGNNNNNSNNTNNTATRTQSKGIVIKTKKDRDNANNINSNNSSGKSNNISSNDGKNNTLIAVSSMETMSNHDNVSVDSNSPIFNMNDNNNLKQSLSDAGLVDADIVTYTNSNNNGIATIETKSIATTTTADQDEFHRQGGFGTFDDLQ